MKEKLQKMSDALAKAHVNAEQFAGGNKSAGVRLRGLMQDIKTLATEVRCAVLSVSKGGGQ
jgi:hypothetical protein